jgi:hypothetical protein
VYDGAVRRADVDVWESGLEGLLARIRPLFYRTESKKHAGQYFRGLLSSIERKNGWTIAEHVGELEPKALQRFLNLSPWDADALLDLNREYAMEHLADPVGARNSATLRDLQIFVDGSAESVTTNDLGVDCFGLGECS